MYYLCHQKIFNHGGKHTYIDAKPDSGSKLF